MKYIRSYNTQNDYIQDFNTIKDLEVHVSLVNDMIGKLEGTENVYVKSNSDSAWVGDVLCWNISTKDWEIVKVQHTYTDSAGTVHDYTKIDNWDSNLIPDAVCVIPACHTDNNKARWIALKQPSGTYIWGDNTYTVPGLTCHTLLPYVGGTYSEDESNDKYYITLHNKFSKDSVSEQSWARLGCEVGFNTGYNNGLNNNLLQTSSNGYEVMEGQLKDPFENNILKIKFYAPNSDPATLNLYGQTDDGSLLLKNYQVFQYANNLSKIPNPICDLDGKGNTDILIANGIDKFPAAKAAVNYSTTYSPAGTWYLPAIGELCYVLSRWYTIQQTLSMLNATISGCASTLGTNTNYWSSTLYSSDNAYFIITNYGYLYAFNKGSYKCVLPLRQY